MYNMFFSMGCWTAPEFTTACSVPVHMYCTVLLTFRNFTHFAQRNALSESRISLWSTKIARQQSENSAAAQPLIAIKHHTPKPYDYGCYKHIKQAASVLPLGQRAEGLKTEDRKFQYQPVDLGVRHGMIFFSLSLILWFYPRERPCFT